MTSKVAHRYMMSNNYLQFILNQFDIISDMGYNEKCNHRMIMIPNCNFESLRTRVFILNWK